MNLKLTLEAALIFVSPLTVI